MLKIKDNVDLKELEKFGFEFDDNTGKYEFKVCYEDGCGIMKIVVNAWNRKIYVRSTTNNIKDEGFLHKAYDLITAGLVEKC